MKQIDLDSCNSGNESSNIDDIQSKNKSICKDSSSSSSEIEDEDKIIHIIPLQKKLEEEDYELSENES